MTTNQERVLQQIQDETQETEQERAENKAEREARKLERLRKQRNLVMEKLFAPLLLAATILVSVVLLSTR